MLIDGFDDNELEYRVEVDFSTRDIIDFLVLEAGVEQIETLSNSGNFQTTHACIGAMRGLIQYLSDEEIIKLFNTANKNEQIYWIAEDGDVKDFFLTLYQGKKNILSQEIKDAFKTHFLVTEEN